MRFEVRTFAFKMYIYISYDILYQIVNKHAKQFQGYLVLIIFSRLVLLKVYIVRRVELQYYYKTLTYVIKCVRDYVSGI